MFVRRAVATLNVVVERARPRVRALPLPRARLPPSQSPCAGDDNIANVVVKRGLAVALAAFGARVVPGQNLCHHQRHAGCCSSNRIDGTIARRHVARNLKT